MQITVIWKLTFIERHCVTFIYSILLNGALEFYPSLLYAVLTMGWFLDSSYLLVRGFLPL